MYNKFFWFAQPATSLNNYDTWLTYLFLLLLVVGAVLVLAKRFLKNPVVKKLLNRFIVKNFTMGISGLLWVGMRYENTPIFAKRIWSGIILIVLIIWLSYLVKYMFVNFRRDKKEYDDFQMKSRYMPGSKK